MAGGSKIQFLRRYEPDQVRRISALTATMLQSQRFLSPLSGISLDRRSLKQPDAHVNPAGLRLAKGVGGFQRAKPMPDGSYARQNGSQ